MKLSALSALVFENINRNRKNLLMSSLGIIVGISALVFFIGLSEGVKEVVLGRIFLIDQVEVIPKKIDLGLFQLDSLFGVSNQDQLNDEKNEIFAKIEGVQGAYPKMKFTFPTFAFGGKQFLGKDIKSELIADGLEPALVESEMPKPNIFRDFDAPSSCQKDQDCIDGRFCQDGQCQQLSCLSKKQLNELNQTQTEESPTENQAVPSTVQPSSPNTVQQCPGVSYCANDTLKCEYPIPVIISEQLLELYNGGLAVALGGGKTLPQIKKEMILGFQFNVELGRSAITRNRSDSMSRKVQVVGFSDKAIALGVTLPIAYVKRFNEKFSGPETAKRYHSIILKVKDQTMFPEIIREVKQKGLDLADKTANAEQAAKILGSIKAIFALVSFVIVGLAAINIGQMFYMLIYQRKREIGLLRALGASAWDIRQIILGEAAVIGFFGGMMGSLVGFGFGWLTDTIVAYLPKFPYKPESFFIYPSWLWALAIGSAILFCLFGAFFPANTAANQQPSEALTQ
jgi:putative ABC transport system permease protein